MINTSKSTEKLQPIQYAGLLPGDNNIEFFGLPKTKQTLWMRNGHTLPWEYLPNSIYNACEQQYLSDALAVEELSQLNQPLNRQVEIYIYHLYGSINYTPDVIDGVLQPSENYRHSKKDTSFNWNTKWIKIDGVALTNRDLRIIDAFIEDIPDKTIADELGISQSTLDFHKRNLYKKLNCTTKVEVIVKAMNQQIN